jgi:RHS repeat-associated protein
LEWEDRLGSKVIGPIDQQTGQSTRYRYYPYGQNIGTNVGWDDVQFATYTRDGATGLDYARNRYYTRTWGRFLSPDPYVASGGPADPGSWNRYAYVQGDPVNYGDPGGLFATGTWDGIPGRYEISTFDCLARIHMGFMSIAVCAGAGGVGEMPRAEQRGGTYDPISPSHLVVMDDCYVKESLESGGKAQRNIFYRLYNASGSPSSGFTITEHLEGDVPISGSTSSGPPTSTFQDQHSILGGKNPQRVTQTFTASNSALRYTNVTVFVRGFTNKSGLAVDYRTLAIYKTDKYIKINDDYGGTFDANGKFLPTKICD